MKKVKAAMVGVGAISGIYLQNIHMLFHEVELKGVCDLIPERAQKAKEQYPELVIYETMHDAFADAEIEIIINLTRPYEHFAVTDAALDAGKHVYTEKPLGATLAEGRALFDKAQAKGLLIGGAPDTFLGAGMETCRRLIDDGYIGTPVGAAAFMICRGHESWHPDPAFYYQFGGGPMMDMGPYYVTALVNMLGGVQKVTGVTRTTFPERVITSNPHRGEVVKVEVPTYITGILQFASGAVGTVFTTFDVHSTTQARLEVYGSEGTLICPDPNTFGGPISLLRPQEGTYREMPLVYDYAENSRGLGLADMANALRTGRAFRAQGEQLLHVLEIMTAFERSSQQEKAVAIESTYEQPAPMALPRIKGLVEA